MPKITKRTLRRQAKRLGSAGDAASTAAPYSPAGSPTLSMNWISSDPVDPDKFCAAAASFNEAGATAPPDSGGTPLASLNIDGRSMSLMDVPLNRALMAAKKILRGLGVDDCTAYFWRLTNLMDVVSGPHEGFGDLILKDATGHRVAAGVIYAAAVAKLSDADPERPKAFDMDDLLATALAYEQRAVDGDQQPVG